MATWLMRCATRVIAMVVLQRLVGLALLRSAQGIVMGIVWPVDSGYKRVVGVADGTPGAQVAGMAVHR